MKIFSTPNPVNSEKSFIVLLLLTVFLGWMGIHRFYVGKVWTALMFLFTGGWLGIGWFLDFIMVVFGQFTDKQGQRVRW